MRTRYCHVKSRSVKAAERISVIYKGTASYNPLSPKKVERALDWDSVVD
jgi:hypothetical protein